VRRHVGHFAGRALVFIVPGDVDEVELAEAPFGLAVGRHWFGYERLDARLLASQNFGTREVATISDHFQLLFADGLSRLLCHGP
jgi:hypothetical protein